MSNGELLTYLAGLPREELEQVAAIALRQRDCYQNMILDLKFAVTDWLREDQSATQTIIKLKSTLFGN